MEDKTKCININYYYLVLLFMYFVVHNIKIIQIGLSKGDVESTVRQMIGILLKKL